MLKRGYVGVFHRMSPAHLHRYVAEFEGRHNARDKSTADQMGAMVRGGEGKRLRYVDPTNHDADADAGRCVSRTPRSTAGNRFGATSTYASKLDS